MQAIFEAFCDATKKGSTTATDKTIKKICTDCKIVSKELNQNLIDIALRKHMGNNKGNIDYATFERFIDGPLGEAFASANKVSVADAAQKIRDKITAGAPQTHGATKTSSDAATARLTDVKGYTGAHKERFDAETGKGKGIEGREYVMDENAKEGYVSGYKGKDTYDNKEK